MGEKVIIGPINKGLDTSRTAFVIDNDSFPTLENAYQWRGRIKRKRGTQFLTRLNRFFNSTISSYNPTNNTIVLGAGSNLLTSFATLQTNSILVQGSITIIDSTNGLTYTDDSNGNLINSMTVLGSVNYVTGAFSITGRNGDVVSASFLYYPMLPALGIEDLVLIPTQFPGTLAFDTTYSYNVSPLQPYLNWDVSFYKNLATDTYPSYVQKGMVSNPITPTTWNGETYQQFWSTNYLGAFWTTNGIPVPFSSGNIGMQYAPADTISAVTAGSTTTITMTISNCPLVVGDFVFFNEWTNTTNINFQTGYVTAASGSYASKTITVTFPLAVLTAMATYVPGIVQYLTNVSNSTKDCLRWYDGDPTSNANPNSPTFVTGNGWVNFAPPISQGTFSIGNLPAAHYYLIGSRMIIPFKDRLIFFGVVVANSTGGVYYLQDAIIYSQNGTPYYTCCFQGTPIAPTNIVSLLVPTNQTATPSAFFSDQTGFGGFDVTGLAQPITTASFNEDVIIVGFSQTQARLVYSGDDLNPFIFYYINSEYGSSSVFSSINFDKGVISKGSRGFIITGQTSCERIDLQIPDSAFEINLLNNGNERLCAVRNYIDEWIYFTFQQNFEEGNSNYNYPNYTLMWNYRDNTWASHYESYTTYGQFRKQTGLTWNTVGLQFRKWNDWNQPWNAGESTIEQPNVCAGNQQGYILIRDQGTGEGKSLSITAINGSTSTLTVPNHNLEVGTYIVISGCLGTIGQYLNGQIFSVDNVVDANNFTLNPVLPGTGTYIGGGEITLNYVPFIQTKQFPTAWGLAKKTRIGAQQYLLTTTATAQITLLIFLSMNSSNAYNVGPIYPAPNTTNDALIYNTVLYTCPESSNIGLSPANINLQMVTASQQQQIWHRINTSLIGDVIQLGFTISDAQMRFFQIAGPSFVITGATNAYPCVLTTTANYEALLMVKINGVVGMTQLNGNVYQVISSTSSTVTINVDSSAFGSYTSGGLINQVALVNGTEEVELHSIILDVSPSQILA